MLMAACPEAKFRDGKGAVKFATRACELTKWKDPLSLNTLAAAQAEAGDFDAAVKSQKKAIELLTDERQKDDYRSRLALYQAKKPYRQASPKTPRLKPPLIRTRSGPGDYNATVLSAVSRMVAVAMILCVTLNPCLDKTLTVPLWHPGDLVRGQAVREVVGGKGNNVARALARLGRKPRPVTFLGGFVGSQCESLLRNRRRSRSPRGSDRGAHPRDPDRPDRGDHRADGLLRPRSRDHADRGRGALSARSSRHLATGAVEALTLSGSSPAPATHGLYSDLIALAQARRVPVFLDTYGPALDGIWGFWPTVIQLNRREAAHPPAESRASPTTTWPACLHDWDRRGVICGVVTDGPNPVVDPLSRPAVSGDPARDQAGQPDRLGRLAPGRPGRRLAQPARARAAVSSCDRLRGRQRTRLGRRCHRARPSGTMA